MQIGILSDTHGLLRPEVIPALAGSEHILHLGDVGNLEILDTLRTIAPVTAIRGNIDTTATLPAIEIITLAGCDLYMLHNLADLDLDPAAAGFRAVLSGHTHKPLIEQKRGVLYFNPGSSGPRRFHLPITCGKLTIANGNLHAEVIELSA